YLWPDGNVPPLSTPAMKPVGYGQVPSIELHIGDDMPPIDTTRVFVAHNLADFDFHIATRFWPRVPQRWYDTLPAARAAGYPGALDDLGQAILGIGKDPAGRALVKKLCKYPSPKTQPYAPRPLHDTPPIMYNRGDFHTQAWRMMVSTAAYGWIN